MSEETLDELFADLRQQALYTVENYRLVAMLEARILRAEAAERAIEAWLAWCDSEDTDGTWDVFKSHVAEYKSAREAVRKLEEAT
jgi:hypothetical protein